MEVKFKNTNHALPYISLMRILLYVAHIFSLLYAYTYEIDIIYWRLADLQKIKGEFHIASCDATIYFDENSHDSFY